jgi:hypothetical protein
VLPFFAVGFLALVAASAVSAVGTLAAALDGDRWLPGWSSVLSSDLALDLFVLPLCVGMSARTFPLFFRAPPPRLRPLRCGLVLLPVGVALREVGDLAALPLAGAAGAAVGGAALLLFVAGLGILGRPRPLPRDPVPYPPDPARLHGQTAYAWLALAGLLRLADAADRLGLVEGQYPLLEVELPLVRVPVRPGRSMAMLIETAARNHLLRRRGRHSALDLADRLDQEIAARRRRRTAEQT